MSRLTLSAIEVPLGALLPNQVLTAPLAQMKVSGMSLHSAHIKPGDIFIALAGSRVRGTEYIAEAVARGAVAVLVDASDSAVQSAVAAGVPIIPVANLMRDLSAIAGRCFGEPSSAMRVMGVTGTNGKSTTVSLLAQLYQRTVGKAATMGTLGVSVAGENYTEFGLTTPDAVLSQKLLAQLRHLGVEMVAMEVSSHGLDQDRVAGVHFREGIFTNLSHDHLDYHGTLANYAAAKQKLFETLGLETAVINLDDPFAPQMVRAAKGRAKVLSYSLLHFAADVYASDLQYSPHGVAFQLDTPWGRARVVSPLLGEFNVANLLAALTALCAAGGDFDQLLAEVPKLRPVAGRMQRVPDSADITVVVDYAHTPDALAHAIAATRVHTSGELWVVFGCGGDRDATKRPLMAGIAERYADRVVVTSDNPRSETPGAIIADICAGFTAQNHLLIEDRARAISWAITHAAPGDTVLLAGKGHEAFQIIGTHKTFFDDVQQAQTALIQRQQIAANGDRA